MKNNNILLLGLGALALYFMSQQSTPPQPQPQPQPKPPEPQPQPFPPQPQPQPQPSGPKDANQIELETKLRALCIKKYGDAGPESRRKMYDEYDSNHDGELSRQEMDRMLSDADVGNWFTRGFWIDGILKKLYTDKSGGLSYAEVEAATNQ